MANTSIGGLVSGLDTASIIGQLMQIEALPQTRLKARVTSEQSAITALQALNTKLSGLATKAKDLTSVASWQPSSTTSSSTNVTVLADAGVAPTSLTFTVGSLATRSQAMYTTVAAKSDVVATAGSSFTIDYPDAGTSETFSTGSGSLQDIAAAINASSSQVQATLVRAGGDAVNPTYRLAISSKETGSTTRFTMTDSAFLGGAGTGAVDGTDATIIVQGQPSTSSSNTFEDLIPGVDVVLGPQAVVGESVTIGVTRDAAALTDKVKAMVDTLNAVLSDISTVTAPGINGAKAGVLAGNATLRQARDQLLSTVTGGVDARSLAAVGIQSDRFGAVTFDAEKFASAYAADPAGTLDMFAVTGSADHGLAAGLERVANSLSRSGDGVVTSLIKGRQSAVEGLGDAIDAWDVRLVQRRANLERQYGALEVALGKLQSQSQWLAGQIGSLPQMSNG